MTRGGSAIKLKPIVVGNIVREAKTDQTMHSKLLGLGENNNTAEGEEKGKKKQWRSTGEDEDKAWRGNKNEHKEERIL